MPWMMADAIQYQNFLTVSYEGESLCRLAMYYCGSAGVTSSLNLRCSSKIAISDCSVVRIKLYEEMKMEKMNRSREKPDTNWKITSTTTRMTFL